MLGVVNRFYWEIRQGCISFWMHWTCWDSALACRFKILPQCPPSNVPARTNEGNSKKMRNQWKWKWYRQIKSSCFPAPAVRSSDWKRTDIRDFNSMTTFAKKKCLGVAWRGWLPVKWNLIQQQLQKISYYWSLVPGATTATATGLVLTFLPCLVPVQAHYAQGFCFHSDHAAVRGTRVDDVCRWFPIRRQGQKIKFWNGGPAENVEVDMDRLKLSKEE